MYSWMLRLSRWMAYLGGLVLCVLIIMTCISILGRSMIDVLNSAAVQALMPAAANWLLAAGVGPIKGDFELVEAGVAFSICAFLPLCTLTGGHASVDVFTNMMSERAVHRLRVFTDMVLAAVMVILAVQLFAGMQSKINSGQTSFLIEFPVWWAYAASFVGLAVTALVSVYVAGARLAELVTGRIILPLEAGADH